MELNLSLSLTLAEIKEIMEVLKDEIDAVSNDSWYAENASFTLEELRQTFDKVNHGLKVFSPIDFNVLNSCAYVKLLGLGDDVEDDDPKVLALESVQTKTWNQRSHWAGGYINPMTEDKEEQKIFMDCEVFKADLEEALRRSDWD